AATVAASIARAPADGESAAEAPAAVETGAAAPAPVGASGGFEATGDEIDDEIREVFLEEFAEEIDNLDALLPPWREEPENLERLRPIRRVFHTLKGSGRLVGARTLGEFSWKIESLLNRVLDGSREPSPAVVAVVDHAFYALPMLQSALKGERWIEVDLAALEADAERIAAGDDAMPQAPVHTSPAGDAPVEPEAEVETPAGAEAGAQVDAAAGPGVEIESPPPPAGGRDTGAAATMVPAQVDELLLEILDTEVAGHLAVVDGWLDAVRAGGPAAADDALL